MVEKTNKIQNRSRSTVTSNSQSQNMRNAKRIQDYTDQCFYSTLNNKNDPKGKDKMVQEGFETTKKGQQSVQNRKEKTNSFLAASMPSALASTEKHDFAAVITANNLPEGLQVLVSPHI